MRSLAVAAVLAAAVAAPAAAAPAPATPWIGIAIVQGTRGVAVDRVLPDTPAERAGLRARDEVVAVDDAPVAAPGELIARLQAKGVGESVTLTVLRDGKPRRATLALAARPDELTLLRGQLVGKKAPGFALAALGASSARLDALAGDVVVVEFWATWCQPCVASMPRLSAWQERYGARGLRVLGLSDEPPADVEHHVAGKHVAYTLAHDAGGAVAAAYRVPAVPTFVVIDRRGVVRFVDVGAGAELAAVEAAFVPLLGER